MSFLEKVQRERRREILGLGLMAFTLLLFLILITDGYHGTAGRPFDELANVPNLLGKPGACVAGVLSLLIGHASHVVYCITMVWAVMLIRHTPLDRLASRVTGLVVLTFSVAGFLHINFASGAADHMPGGAVGAFAGDHVSRFFGAAGANVTSVTLVLVGILLATEFLVLHVFVKLHGMFLLTLQGIVELGQAGRQYLQERRERVAARRRYRLELATKKHETALALARASRSAAIEEEAGDLSRIRVRPEPGKRPEDEMPFDVVPALDAAPAQPAAQIHAARLASPWPAVAEAQKESEEDWQLELLTGTDGAAAHPIAARTKRPVLPRRKVIDDAELPPDYVYPKRYTKPLLDILEPPEERVVPDLGDALRRTGLLLEEKLETFGIEARVTDVTRGPTITRYELEPAPGIKVSRFLSLADDLALALKAHRVRVVAPIPGKGRVGVEVPNPDRESVVLRELIESRTFRRSGAKLPLTLGKDIAGDVIMPDLATMPHLLVAGATGSGKTVCVKSLLASLLFSKTPEELQLMLVDPKMVELSIFNDIPHLITPVVTDPKKAASALNWLIVEMEERYDLFAHLRVRNIEVYNESVENGEIEMPDGEEGDSVDVIRKLPYIVCVIDELADLMMLARAEVEDAIARLAQLARAVGIHLVIATQRPSVDVLTVVIKANFPARVSFQVSSRVDSRCILDEIGAERLIGQGDMLYLPAGRSKPLRIQGAFVSDEEMNSLVAYLKTQAPPQYRDEIENFGKASDTVQELDDETDELLDEAVRVVLETGQASISMVQRRLRVGYTRAARLIDMMEMKGIVGPHLGSKAREILIDYTDLQN